MNVTARSLSPTSVEVAWVGSNVPELAQWVIYYSTSSAREMSVNVSAGNMSAVINGLRENAQYTFQVAAVIVENSRVVFGERRTAAMVEETSRLNYVAAGSTC